MRGLRVLLGGDDVGVVSREDGRFVFRYSEDFVRSGLPPVPGFPRVTSDPYESANLWPFFLVRIPPTNRPDVARVLREHRVNEDDVFDVLRVLGRRAVASAYEMVAD